jgi:hypothetical protein
MRLAGNLSRVRKNRDVYRVLVGKPEGKRPHGRPRRTWRDNIKMHLQEMGFGNLDWIELAQDRDKNAGTFECGNETSGSKNAGNFFVSGEQVSFLRRTVLRGLSNIYIYIYENGFIRFSV